MGTTHNGKGGLKKKKCKFSKRKYRNWSETVS